MKSSTTQPTTPRWIIALLICSLLMPFIKADNDDPTPPSPEPQICPSCLGIPVQACGKCDGGYIVTAIWAAADCDICDGTGLEPWTDGAPCNMCGGNWQDAYGNVICNFCDDGWIELLDRPCSYCGTTGTREIIVDYETKSCDSCDSGWIDCGTCGGFGLL